MTDNYKYNIIFKVEFIGSFFCMWFLPFTELV